MVIILPQGRHDRGGDRLIDRASGRNDGNTSRIGLSATSRSGEIRDIGSGSSFGMTGRGGSGYEDGATGKPPQCPRSVSPYQAE